MTKLLILPTVLFFTRYEHLICISGGYDRWYKIWNLNSPFAPVTALKRGIESKFSATIPLGKEKVVFNNNPRHGNTLEVCLFVCLFVFGGEKLLVASCYRNQDKLRPDWPVGSFTDFVASVSFGTTLLCNYFAGISHELHWSAGFGTIVSCEDDSFQNQRYPCVARFFTFVNTKDERLTSLATAHNSTIWVCT